MVAASLLSSSSSSSSPAEIQVRKVASRIGLDDSEILSRVFHKMRQEYVVAEWQLSALDSRQWEKLHAPIGLAVAVRHISAYELPPDHHRLQQRQNNVRSETQIKKDDNNDDDEKQLHQQQKKKRTLVVVEEEEKAPVATLTMISKQEEKEEIKTANISHDEDLCDVREGESGEEEEEERNPLISIVTTTPTKNNKTVVDERNEAPEEVVETLLVGGVVEENEQVKRNLSLTVPDDEFDEDHCVGNNMLEKVVTTEEENKHEMILSSEKKSSDIGESSAIIHTEEKLETQVEANTTKTEVPVLMSSSDSEPEDSIIIADIGLSTSSSTDEDDVFDDEEEETYNYLLDPLIDDDEDNGNNCNSDTIGLWLHDDDITVAVSNVSPDCKKKVSRRTKEIKQYKQPSKKETSTYVLETAALQEILLNFPDDDHRAILSQLMIMANARDEVSRTNIAFQVKNYLLNTIEKCEIEIDSDKAIKLIFHLARLKKPHRSLFGKSLFKAMSKLFKRTEKLKEKYKKEKKELFPLDQERSQQPKEINNIDRQETTNGVGSSFPA